MRMIDADAMILHINDIALAASPNDTDSDKEKYRKHIAYETLQECMSIINLYAHEHQETNTASAVRCKECVHCLELPNGAGFTCSAWDMDFYSPAYDAAQYYCADGKRRDDDAKDGTEVRRQKRDDVAYRV